MGVSGYDGYDGEVGDVYLVQGRVYQQYYVQVAGGVFERVQFSFFQFMDGRVCQVRQVYGGQYGSIEGIVEGEVLARDGGVIGLDLEDYEDVYVCYQYQQVQQRFEDGFMQVEGRGVRVGVCVGCQAAVYVFLYDEEYGIVDEVVFGVEGVEYEVVFSEDFVYRGVEVQVGVGFIVWEGVGREGIGGFRFEEISCINQFYLFFGECQRWQGFSYLFYRIWD